MTADRLMLRQLEALAAARTDFAFETTLSSRTFAPWLQQLQRSGYEVLVVFLSLASPTLSIERVRTRVAAGGHAIPTDVKRIRVAKTNLETQRQNLLTGISSLRQTLQFLCGLPFEENLDLVPT